MKIVGARQLARLVKLVINGPEANAALGRGLRLGRGIAAEAGDGGGAEALRGPPPGVVQALVVLPEAGQDCAEGSVQRVVGHAGISQGQGAKGGLHQGERPVRIRVRPTRAPPALLEGLEAALAVPPRREVEAVEQRGSSTERPAHALGVEAAVLEEGLPAHRPRAARRRQRQVHGRGPVRARARLKRGQACAQQLGASPPRLGPLRDLDRGPALGAALGAEDEGVRDFVRWVKNLVRGVDHLRNGSCEAAVSPNTATYRLAIFIFH